MISPVEVKDKYKRNIDEILFHVYNGIIFYICIYARTYRKKDIYHFKNKGGPFELWIFKTLNVLTSPRDWYMVRIGPVHKAVRIWEFYGKLPRLLWCHSSMDSGDCRSDGYSHVIKIGGKVANWFPELKNVNALNCWTVLRPCYSLGTFCVGLYPD